MEAALPSNEPAKTSAKRLVLVVDDHPVLRQGVGAVLQREHDFEACEAGNAAEALEVLRRLKPEAAVIDISLPGTDGIQLIKLMKRVQPKLKILVLSMQEEWEYGVPALRAGANGYLMKDHAATDLVPALRQVMSDLLYISSKLKNRILALAPDDGPPPHECEAHSSPTRDSGVKAWGRAEESDLRRAT